MKQFNIFKGFILTILLVCCNAVWAYNIEVDGIYYNITSTTDLTVGVTSGDNSYSGDIVIPSTITYKSRTFTVTSIGEGAFGYCSDLTSVTIGNSVTSIESWAFSCCSGLTSVTIGNSVTSIESGAFGGCSGLTSITIPNSVTSIELYAFSGCSGLKEVHVADLAAWCNISFGNDSANPLCCARNLYLNGELITELVIPDDVMCIKSYAFSGCNITGLKIPNGVKTIDKGAFYGCSTLANIKIPNSITFIDNYVFNGCTSLKNLHIEDGEEVLRLGCNEIPLYSYQEGKGLFYDCPLQTVYIGRDLSYESDYSSHSSGYYGYSAFYNNTTLTTTILGDYVTSIRIYTFKYCSSLTNIEIPNSVTSIESYAFSYCKELTSMTIPQSVTHIGDYVFQDCNSLESIYVMSETPPSVSSNSFTDSNYIISTIYVPTGSLEAYQNANVWKDFWEIREFDTTSIGNVKTENENATTVYDIDGRIVENPTNGIYIVNRKKVLIK